MNAIPEPQFRWCSDSITYWAEMAPDAIALTDAVAVLTNVGLEAAVVSAAEGLSARGVGPGDRVLVICESSVAASVALSAAQRLRAWPIPVNARMTAAEIDRIADHARPKAVIVTTGVSPEGAAHAARMGAAEPFGRQGAVIADMADPGAPEPVTGDPAHDVAALIYTTGTTGNPKGVMLTHDNFMFVAERSAMLRADRGAEHIFCPLPLAHVFGLGAILGAALYRGARIDFAARFDPVDALRRFAEDGITSFSGVPAMFAAIAAVAEAKGGVTAPALTFIGNGGAPLDPDLKRRIEVLFGQPLHNGYGLTETAPLVSVTPLDGHCETTSVGPAPEGIETRIVAPDGTTCATGDVGELWIRGRNIMRGYYKSPDQTAEAITPEGWFRSGDLARLDERGFIYIAGRLKELIIRSGFNVYPPEVEGVLTKHPAVALAAVVGRRAVDGNEEVLAFVQPKPGHSLDPEELEALARSDLAPYKRPAEYHLRAALPAAATGKILKHKLLDLLEDTTGSM